MLLLFLQNTIEACTPAPGDATATTPMGTPNTPANPAATNVPQEELKLRLAVWPDFKQLIFEIYDHRIENAPEINGAINNTYMSMEEHLICFFALKYRTRHQIERRIIEFLASLKYFGYFASSYLLSSIGLLYSTSNFSFYFYFLL